MSVCEHPEQKKKKRMRRIDTVNHRQTYTHTANQTCEILYTGNKPNNRKGNDETYARARDERDGTLWDDGTFWDEVGTTSIVPSSLI